jgi:uncharacterized RmlC-like cupin family protein
MGDPVPAEKPDWKNHGLRILRGGQWDTNTPQTLGMTRAEAISHAKVGAQKIRLKLTPSTRLPTITSSRRMYLDDFHGSEWPVN